jgi:serine/threonine protein kinase
MSWLAEGQPFVHGDLQPSTIHVIQNDGSIKLIPPALVDGLSGYEKMLGKLEAKKGEDKQMAGEEKEGGFGNFEGYVSALSPRLMKALNRGEKWPNYDPVMADIWSLGMTLLNCATKRDFKEFYDFYKGKIDYKAVDEELEKAKELGYSTELVALIRACLQRDERERIKLSELCEVIQEIETPEESEDQIKTREMGAEDKENIQKWANQMDSKQSSLLSNIVLAERNSALIKKEQETRPLFVRESATRKSELWASKEKNLKVLSRLDSTPKTLKMPTPVKPIRTKKLFFHKTAKMNPLQASFKKSLRSKKHLIQDSNKLAKTRLSQKRNPSYDPHPKAHTSERVIPKNFPQKFFLQKTLQNPNPLKRKSFKNSKRQLSTKSFTHHNRSFSQTTNIINTQRDPRKRQKSLKLKNQKNPNKIFFQKSETGNPYLAAEYPIAGKRSLRQVGVPRYLNHVQNRTEILKWGSGLVSDRSFFAEHQNLRDGGVKGSPKVKPRYHHVKKLR